MVQDLSLLDTQPGRKPRKRRAADPGIRVGQRKAKQQLIERVAIVSMRPPFTL